MNRYQSLLETAARELGISMAAGERPAHWKYRVLYSIVCRMAYASLFDEPEAPLEAQRESVSITHFKRRVERVLSEYLVLYPECAIYFTGDRLETASNLFGMYQRAGYFYHEPMRIRVSCPSTASAKGIRFERGMPLCRPQRMSGAGMYTLTESEPAFQSTLVRTVHEMFGLSQTPLRTQWDQIIKQAMWNPKIEEVRLEYLREEPPFYRGYWLRQPLQNTVSVCRIVPAAQYCPEPAASFLYDTRGEGITIGRLPGWLTEDPHFGNSDYRLANACLSAHGRLPAILYRLQGETVELELQYLLPPAEETFLELYSWPDRVSDQAEHFHRWMSSGVFEAFRSVLEPLDYTFREK